MGLHGEREWSSTPSKGGVEVHLSGDIDLSVVPELEHLFADLVDTRGSIVIDARDVTFLDTTGLGCLLRFKAQIERTNTRLVLKEASAIVRRVLDVAGVSAFFPVEGSP